MKTNMFNLALIAMGLVGATSAKANLDVTFDGVSPNEIIYLSITGDVPNYSGGVYAGIYNNTVNGVFTPGFCIDVSRDSGAATADYNYTSLASSALAPAGPMGAAAATTVEQLWYNYYAAAENNGATAAALQLAIWETVEKGPGLGYDITVGTDPTSAAAQAEANSMVAYVDSLRPGTDVANLVGLTSPDSQNYVVAAVPEPATILSGVFMLLPFGAGTLRIVRKRQLAS
jgi:hypothetical protein